MPAANADSQFAVAQQALEDALAQFRKASPKPLLGFMKLFAETRDETVPEDTLAQITGHLQECGPNDRSLHALILALQGWDHGEPTWAEGTQAHSVERRRMTLERLGFVETQHEVINSRVLISTPQQLPVVIAEQHEEWYTKRRQSITPFYWQHYADQLMSPAGRWSADSVAVLETSVDDVIGRLSDPTRLQAYGARGLVMGYVQSGKTSHFAGLISKAADAGYRLIIVLAGTLDILRQQTQRRIDKHVVGTELIPQDEYANDSDWKEFVAHGGRPSDIGGFDWQRLTDSSEDYASLRRHLPMLDFGSADRTKPFNHPDNLRAAPAKLIIIKKNHSRLNSLCNDLARLKPLRTQLAHVPTLIIDDESDQASINTIKPENRTERKSRTGTNAAIVRLLSVLPRAQYVGYTATPFANVFVDPDDEADLFPRDFIVSLPRPEGYMGAADFYDFTATYPEGDFAGNYNAFVRPVEGDNTKICNLPKAIDAFVLSGAIKLFRQATDPETYNFRHHTMLVHHNAARVVHDSDADEVNNVFRGGARYQGKVGIDALRKLFDDDYKPVSKVRSSGAPIPSSFDELIPFVSACLTRITSGKPVRIVNGEGRHADDTPDFDQNEVWAILVGGTKLSRGYTVEGLTISYYRRVAGTGDSLMQMGRWFGFRKGYVDLVRLFIGRKESKGKVTVDLYETFGSVCRDEEALRADLQKYSRHGLTPKQVPPLVRQHASHLPPTSRNKMFNAEIASRDLAGEWEEKTVAPIEPKKIRQNLETLSTLLKGSGLGKLLNLSCSTMGGAKHSFKGLVFKADGAQVLRFLTDYQWTAKDEPLRLVIQYINEQLANGHLEEWSIMLPQAETDDKVSLPNGGPKALARIARSRVATGRFNVYSEPRHRGPAAAIAAVESVKSPSADLVGLLTSARPVLLVYLVKDKNSNSSETTVGFALQFPGTKNPAKEIVWTVRDKRNASAVVVPVVSK
jgi:hypothetical protein